MRHQDNNKKQVLRNKRVPPNTNSNKINLLYSSLQIITLKTVKFGGGNKKYDNLLMLIFKKYNLYSC